MTTGMPGGPRGRRPSTDHPRPLLYVVPHVHWDREWYRTFEAFRSRLLHLTQSLLEQLDEGRIPTFHLDGQTITIADVLQVRPELEESLRSHMHAGRLVVGPWHTLADNQLCTGETLIRNLLIGRRWTRRLGARPVVGYSPDAFGHPADLPRLLRGFGIDTALVWRGAPPETARFTWVSPDGSSVLAINQAYYAADVLWPGAGVAERVRSFVHAQQLRDPEGPWLLLDGADHVLPSDTLSRVDAVPDDVPGVRVARLDEYVAAVRAHGPPDRRVEGELRHLGDRLTFLLPGTLSSLTWLKQLNRQAQLRLERVIEPAVTALGDETDRALLDQAWDLVVANTAHDSICGCSLDEVHEQTRSRAQSVLDIAETLDRRLLLRRGLDPLVTGGRPSPGTEVVVVDNPAGAPARGPVEVDVLTDPDHGIRALLDPDGARVDIEVTDLGLVSRFGADTDRMPDTRTFRHHRVAFATGPLPAFGQVVYRLVQAPGPDPALRPTCRPGRELTVDGRRVSLDADATIRVRDLASGREWSGLGRLVDDGDRGDTYNADPVDGVVEPQVRVVEAECFTSAVRHRLVARVRLTVPSSLSADRSGRSAETVEMPITLQVTRWHGVPGLHVTVEGDNRARDHRLRWQVPVPGATGWAAGLHWSRVSRPLCPDVGPRPEQPGHEAAVAAAPTHGYTLAQGGPEVAVLTRGMPEVAGLAEDTRTPAMLSVTLLRSVGWLSRSDLSTRTASAGPAVEAPAAQVPGPFRVDLGLLLGDEVPVGDPLALQVQADLFDAGLHARMARRTTRDVASANQDGRVPEVLGALVAAWKPADDGTGCVLRVWNPGASTVSASLDAAERTLTECRLDETPVGSARSGRVVLDLEPYAVHTYRVATTDEREDRGFLTRGGLVWPV